MFQLHLALLGPLQITRGGEPLMSFPTRSAEALLVCLAVEGRRLPRDFLAELLWPDLPPGSGRKNLRQALYELRQTVGPLSARDGGSDVGPVAADRETVRLEPAAAISLDVAAFEQGIHEGTPAALQAAAELYRDDFLAGFALAGSAEFDDWLLARRAHCQRLVLEALSGLADHHLAQGDWSAAAAAARRQLTLDDLREPAVQQLMAALARSGQRGAALNAAAALSDRLRTELGADLSRQTKALVAQIQQGELPAAASILPVRTSAPSSTHRVPNNLPPQTTSFVGREKTLAELVTLLADDPAARLLTLLGPGGSGKTRLALEAAVRLEAAKASPFADGVFFVPLAAVDEAQALVPRAADALGVALAAEGISPRRQLLDYLRERRLLLILDNYEQLLGEPEALLPLEILSAAPGLKVLVTSRARLNLQGERVYPVQGLALPQGDAVALKAAAASDAVQLFVNRARQEQPDFALDAETLPAVLEICRLLEGMPLGIELAAGWVAMLPPAAIAKEIARDLDFLRTDWEDVPQRQRSLRAVFDVSWRLLNEREQGTLMRLAVFRSGFDRAGAVAVARADLPVLLSLVNKSWLIHDQGERYHVHELLRQYAYQALECVPFSWQQARDAHAGHVAGWLADENEALRGPDQIAALDRIARDFEDVRAAWRWLVRQGEVEAGVLQMLPAIFLYCAARWRGSDLLALVRSARGAPPSGGEMTLARAVLYAAEAAFSTGYYVPAMMTARLASLVIPPEPLERARAAYPVLDCDESDGLWPGLVALLSAWSLDEGEGLARLRSLVERYRRAGDRWSMALNMQHLGRHLSQSLARYRGPSEGAGARQAEARQMLNQAAAVFEALGDDIQLAHTLRILGITISYSDPVLAERTLLQARRLLEQIGDRVTATHVLWSLAEIYTFLQRRDDAFAAFREMRARYETLGQRYLLAATHSLEALHMVRYGDLNEARQIRQEGIRLGRELGHDEDTAWQLWELGDLERTAGNLALARQHIEAARVHFEKLEGQHGISFCERGMGSVALAAGRLDEAQGHFERALAVAETIDDGWHVALLTILLGRLALARRDVEKAQAQFRTGIVRSQAINHDDLLFMALAGRAEGAALSGDHEQALLLAAFVANHHHPWNEIRRWAAEIVEAAAMVLPEAEAGAVRARGEKATLLEVLALPDGDR